MPRTARETIRVNPVMSPPSGRAYHSCPKYEETMLAPRHQGRKECFCFPSRGRCSAGSSHESGVRPLHLDSLGRNNCGLPPILAHCPTIQARQIFSKQDHAHRHGAAHAVLPLLGCGVTFEEFLLHAAMSFFVFCDSSLWSSDPFRHGG